MKLRVPSTLLLLLLVEFICEMNKKRHKKERIDTKTSKKNQCIDHAMHSKIAFYFAEHPKAVYSLINHHITYISNSVQCPENILHFHEFNTFECFYSEKISGFDHWNFKVLFSRYITRMDVLSLEEASIFYRFFFKIPTTICKNNNLFVIHHNLNEA